MQTLLTDWCNHMHLQLKKWKRALVAYVREFGLIIALMGGALAIIGLEFNLSVPVVGAIGGLIGGAIDTITQATRPS
jgi:hypothetical protein